MSAKDTGPKRGPGQPRIGQQIKATLPDDQVAALAAMVESGEAKTLADAVRQAVARGLSRRSATRTGTAATGSSTVTTAG